MVIGELLNQLSPKKNRGLKGAVTLGNLFYNMSRNFVAIQVARKIAKCNIPLKRRLATFLVPQSLREVELGSTFRNDPPNAATNFTALRRGVTLSNVECNFSCNDATKLWHKLQEKLPSVTAP